MSRPICESSPSSYQSVGWRVTDSALRCGQSEDRNYRTDPAVAQQRLLHAGRPSRNPNPEAYVKVVRPSGPPLVSCAEAAALQSSHKCLRTARRASRLLVSRGSGGKLSTQNIGRAGGPNDFKSPRQ
jgi:hypothetical protein